MQRFQSPRTRLVRQFSSNPEYLSAWLGNSSPKLSNAAQSVQPSASNSASPPLSPMHITGQTFLIPTVKLPRTATPTNLETTLAASMNASPAARSLLANKEGVPLVIDLAAFVPDGSPHFQPVPDTDLLALLHALQAGSLHPVAITSSSGTLQHAIERVAAAVGLPYVMPAGGRGGKQGVVNFEEVFKVVKMGGDSSQAFTPALNAAPDAEIRQRNVDLSQEIDRLNASLDAAVATAAAAQPQPVVTSPALTAPPKTTVHHGNVRSGQQISSEENGSVIVVGNVSSGGEVVSDGSVHVYGRLLGRAFCGLGENEDDSRIFASHFDPELVCIEGVMIDGDEEMAGLERGKSGMAWLEDGVLKFKKL